MKQECLGERNFYWQEAAKSLSEDLERELDRRHTIQNLDAIQRPLPDFYIEWKGGRWMRLTLTYGVKDAVKASE